MMLLICDWAGRVVNLLTRNILGRIIFTRPEMPMPLSGFSDFLAPILLLFCVSRLDFGKTMKLRPHHTTLLIAAVVTIAALLNTEYIRYIAL